MIKKLKDEKLEDLVKEGEVLVDFNATWCGPCRMLEPVLEEFSDSRGKVKVISVDVDQHDVLAREYGIMSVPTLLVYRDGKLVKQNTGFVQLDEIESWFK